MKKYCLTTFSMLLIFSPFLLKAQKIDTQIESIDAKNKNITKLRESYPSLKRIHLQETARGLTLGLSGNFPVLREIDLETTSGSIQAKLTGNFKSLISGYIRTTSGSVRLDMRGLWKSGVELEMSSTSGNIDIVLPKDIGVKVRISTLSGKVRSGDLQQKRSKKGSQEYVNQQYEKTDSTITIDVSTTSGNITLR